MREPAKGQQIPQQKKEDGRRRQESGAAGQRGAGQREDEKGDRRRRKGGPGHQPKHVDAAAEAWSRNPNLSPPLHLARPE